jgi:hypothetical protein
MIGKSSDASIRTFCVTQLFLSCNHVFLLRFGSIWTRNSEVLVVEAIHNSNTVITVRYHWIVWICTQYLSH